MKYLRSLRRSQAAILAGALTIGLAVAGYAASRNGTRNPPVEMKLAPPSHSESHAGFAPILKKVAPAIVSIESTKSAKIPTQFSNDEMLDNPLFRRFFGDQGQGQGRQPRQMPQQRERGLGSGVILSPDGYIVTNNHVIDGATGIRVTLADKREFKAKLIGGDAKSDIAVLKIDATNLPTVTVGDSSTVQVGDYALALGNPFGVGQTITMGIVSATGRSQLGIEEYEDFIQTDAAINPGNSGGALVNDRGELVGINTAILSHGSGGNQGIGFAVPVNMARNVIEQLVQDGKVRRAYLGVVPQDVTPAIAKAFGEKEVRGALVGDVSSDGPGKSAGIEQGDIIVDVNGKPVEGANGLRMAISQMQPDSTVTLHVFRRGNYRDLSVKLGELPTTMAEAKTDTKEDNTVLSGVSVENLDSQTAQELKLPASTHGVVVTKVNPSSEAAEAGLRRGDVIQEVNRKPVSNTSDLQSAIGKSNDQTLLLVNRNGRTLFIAV